MLLAQIADKAIMCVVLVLCLGWQNRSQDGPMADTGGRRIFTHEKEIEWAKLIPDFAQHIG
jgi:hypothetical protein